MVHLLKTSWTSAGVGLVARETQVAATAIVSTAAVLASYKRKEHLENVFVKIKSTQRLCGCTIHVLILLRISN